MKKYICVMLSILLLLSSLMGCAHNKPDSSGNSNPSNPSDSLLGTEATSPNTETTNKPSENTDPSDVTEPNDGSQPSEGTGSSDSTDPGEDTTPSESTGSTENTDPSDGTEPPEKTEPSEDTETPTEPTQGETEPPVTSPPETEPPVTSPPETEPAPTTPPVTEPQPTDPPVTEPPATEPPATEAPEITIPDEDNPFDQTEPPIVLPVEPKPPVVPSTEPPHSHTYSKAVTEATCTTGGYTTYTCLCGDSYVADETNARGHSYTDTVVPPTTSEKGYTKHVCVCGHSYTDSYVDPIVEEFPFTDTELAAAVIKYINEYRKQDGAPELVPQSIMGEIAKIRSEQLLTDYKHDVRAIRKICAEFQYGEYIDMTQYGYDSSYNYYDARLAEAIGHFAAVKEPVENTAKVIALAFRNSDAHWSYLGDPEMKYVAVGCSKDKYDWYACIFVSDVTYG